MIMENILGISYLVVGLIVTTWIWNKDYALDYAIAKAKGEAQDSTACLLMLCMITFWPLKLIHKIIKKFL